MELKLPREEPLNDLVKNSRFILLFTLSYSLLRTLLLISFGNRFLRANTHTGLISDLPKVCGGSKADADWVL